MLTSGLIVRAADLGIELDFGGPLRLHAGAISSRRGIDARDDTDRGATRYPPRGIRVGYAFW
jgi:hypothetical protein